MAKTRVKKVIISGITSEQAEIAFSEFATADAKVQNIQSKMDMEITRIRDKYADVLAEQQAIREKNFEIMQTFATEHREELFSRRKSYESAHGTFGFRTGTPKLKGFTWASVTNLVKEFLPAYIRVSEELAKDRLLADRDKEEVAEQLSKCGMVVVQDETFYVEPKKENEQPS